MTFPGTVLQENDTAAALGQFESFITCGQWMGNDREHTGLVLGRFCVLTSLPPRILAGSLRLARRRQGSPHL